MDKPVSLFVTEDQYRHSVRALECLRDQQVQTLWVTRMRDPFEFFDYMLTTETGLLDPEATASVLETPVVPYAAPPITVRDVLEDMVADCAEAVEGTDVLMELMDGPIQLSGWHVSNDAGAHHVSDPPGTAPYHERSCVLELDLAPDTPESWSCSDE